ncbi:hypothetical protein F4810DRAFT_726096 [Camillea tinctor]|nr:hypothetical protein F4810DRAFT_726096 [Camillea tinctor]
MANTYFKMTDFLLKIISRLFFAFIVCFGLYGYYIADTEQKSSVFFYYFTVGSLLSILYTFHVHLVLGTLTTLLAIVLYYTMFDLEFCIGVLSLCCQMYISMKTEYGIHSFLVGFTAYTVYGSYKDGWWCLLRLPGVVITFILTRLMSEVVTPSVDGVYNIYDPSSQRESTTGSQVGVTRQLYDWVISYLVKELVHADYETPLKDFMKAGHDTTRVFFYKPLLYVVDKLEERDISLRIFGARVNRYYQEARYELFGGDEPAHVKSRRIGAENAAKTMKEYERLDREREKQRSENARQQLARMEADRIQKRKNDAEEKARMEKEAENERTRRARQAQWESEQYPPIHPPHPLPSTVSWRSIRQEMLERREQVEKDHAWIEEASKQMPNDDEFVAMMNDHFAVSVERSTKLGEEILSNPLPITSSGTPLNLTNGRSPFQYTPWKDVPKNETIIPAVKAPYPNSGPPFYRPVPQMSPPRPSVLDKVVPLDVSSYPESVRPCNVLLGGLRVANDQKRQILQEQQRQEQQTKERLQELARTRFDDEPDLATASTGLSTLSKAQPVPSTDPAPAPTGPTVFAQAPKSLSVLNSAPTGPSVFATPSGPSVFAKPSGPSVFASGPKQPTPGSSSTPVNKLLAAAAEGKFASVDQHQPVQEEKLAWDPMDIDDPPESEPESLSAGMDVCNVDNVDEGMSVDPQPPVQIASVAPMQQFHQGFAQQEQQKQQEAVQQYSVQQFPQGSVQQYFQQQQQEQVAQKYQQDPQGPLFQQPGNTAMEYPKGPLEKSAEQIAQSHPEKSLQEYPAQPLSQPPQSLPHLFGGPVDPDFLDPQDPTKLDPGFLEMMQEFVDEGPLVPLSPVKVPDQQPAGQVPSQALAVKPVAEQPKIPGILGWPGPKKPSYPHALDVGLQKPVKEDNEKLEEGKPKEVRVPNKRSKRRDESPSPPPAPPSRSMGRGSSSSSSQRPKTHGQKVRDLMNRGFTEARARAMVSAQSR